MNGFLNLLKPPGMTSSQAVVAIRRTLSGEKVGHAGTLDPEAAGVLPIMIGKASRLFDVLVEKRKAYVGEIAFGVETDSWDADGDITRRTDETPTEEALRAVLPRFTGDIMQTPPVFSALKIGGRAAYSLARSGEAPRMAPRPARIDAIELLEMRPPDGALLEVTCGKGVYIRSLCHDIGQALGCGAHMRFLLRTASGSFDIGDAVTLEEWLDSADRQALLRPMDAPLGHLPRAHVPEALASACRSGAPITRMEKCVGEVEAGGPVRVYCGGEFVGLARWRDGALRFQAMLWT